MSSTLRRFAILAILSILVLLLTPTLRAAARPQPGSAESLLFDAANRDRASAGLSQFQWDASLAASAQRHAQLMAQHNTLSHQFPGELPVQDRARQSGARFSVIAENIAEGPSINGLHVQWMHSAPHRANLLANDMNAVGIAVVQNGNMLFAVEDFSQAVAALDLDSQESRVVNLLFARGFSAVSATSEARQTCDLDRGFAGQKPLAVLRYETADLGRLPDDIAQKLQSGKYRSAEVGACDAGSSAGFTRFRIAILLFPSSASNQPAPAHKSGNGDHKRILACLSGWTR